MEKLLTKQLLGFSIKQCLEFLFGVGGIYLSYTAFGYFQEKICVPYYNQESKKSEKFDGFLILLLPQLVLSSVFSKLILMIQNTSDNVKMDFKDSLVIGLINATTVGCTSMALSYVSFFLQNLMKSAKVLSVVFISLFVGGKRHSLSKYICALFIFLGIFIFQYFDGNKKQSSKQSTYTGIFLLIVSLIFDGLVGESQERLRQKFKQKYDRQVNQWDLQMAMNVPGAVVVFIISILNGEAVYFIAFCQNYPLFMIDLFYLTMSQTIGQVFIFYVISKYGPILLSIITTTRKCLTMWLSIIVFQHQVNTMQYLGIFFVVLGLAIETKESYEKQKLKNKLMEKDVGSTKKTE